MALIMKATASKGGDYEYPEPGNQAAVLVAIVDLGTVNREYQGKAYDAREVYFVWELTTQQMTGSTNNHVVGRVYGRSFSEKSNLRKMIGKWIREIKDGEEVDLSKLLGQTCLLDVQAVEGKSYVKLDPLCASKLPKGMDCPPAKRKPTLWEIEGHDQLPENLDWLPFIYGESVQDRIKRSNEWREVMYAQSQGRSYAQSPGRSANGIGAASKEEGAIPDGPEEDAPF